MIDGILNSYNALLPAAVALSLPHPLLASLSSDSDRRGDRRDNFSLLFRKVILF